MKSWNEIRKAATAFSKRWKNAYDEKSQAQSFLKELFAVYGRMPPVPETVAGEMLSEKLTEDRFAVERRYRVWFREDKTGPFIDWLVHVPRYAPKPCPRDTPPRLQGQRFSRQ